MRILPLAWPHGVLHALSVYDVFEKTEIESKLIVIGVVRACVFKQATQTQDVSQSFHNLSTKVSSVTYVYVQRQWVCVCVSVFVFSVAFSTHLPLCCDEYINNNVCYSNKPWIQPSVSLALLKTCSKFPHISCYSTHQLIKLHQQGSIAPQTREVDLTQQKATGLWGLLEWHNHIIYFSAAGEATSWSQVG